MAQTDWIMVNLQFQRDQAKTNCSVREWCEENGYNYQSARRYLKSSAQSSSSSGTFHVAASKRKLTPDKPGSKQPISDSGTNAQSAQAVSNDAAQSTECATAQTEDNFRDSKGRFTVGNPGYFESIKDHCFKPGNQKARKHGGYSRFFPSAQFDAAAELKLRDELLLARTQIISLAEKLQMIDDDLGKTDDPDQRVKLYQTLAHLQDLLDKKLSRVESITKTLSSLQIDKLIMPKTEADTKRSAAVAKKAEIEARILEREEGAISTPISDIIDDIQTMGSGLMSSKGE